RGMPGPVPDELRGHVRSIGHLADDALTGALLGADLIVGRTGYSTVMDLERIGRTALLVPTPGQPEQEYLGRLHKDNGRFIVQVQGELDIAAALESRVAGTRIPTTRDSGERQLDVAMKELAGLLPGRCSGT
ncbi:MAG TPA: glycosyltransferase, partial [Flavobacteriales bacterium]|nr:glycosyltransferase [Flavobacteriales bacterium]